MNIIFFSPNFPPNFKYFCVALKNLSCNVLGIDSAPYEQINPVLRDSMTEYYRVTDMEDYDQVLRAVAYFTHKYGKIDRIESHTEYWLESDARIRTDFNIQGIKTDFIDKIKHKSLMKKKFIEAGVKVAPGEIVGTIAEAEKFIKKAGYPVIAKPDNGVGAAATFKIKSQEELTEFFAAKDPDVVYFMEGFITGELYSFDGLVDRDGKPVFYTSHYFGRGVMETVQDQWDISYYSLREIPPKLEEAGLATLKAFDVRERFFHFEYFITPEGDVVALEVNMRPPGGLSMDMFNYANDINLYQQWANVMVNNEFTEEYSRKYYCAYACRRDHKKYRYTHEEILKACSDTVVHSEPISGIFSGALGNFGYLVRDEDLDKVKKVIELIQTKV